MATKFYCRNEKCDKYNEEIHFNSVSYVIRDGHLTPKERLVCDHCNQEVEMVNVKNEGGAGFNLARFDSLSNDDKKRWIMERNKKVRKHDAEMKRFYEKKILGINLD
jgi:hypothetical protein